MRHALNPGRDIARPAAVITCGSLLGLLTAAVILFAGLGAYTNYRASEADTNPIVTILLMVAAVAGYGAWVRRSTKQNGATE